MPLTIRIFIKLLFFYTLCIYSVSNFILSTRNFSNPIEFIIMPLSFIDFSFIEPIHYSISLFFIIHILTFKYISAWVSFFAISLFFIIEPISRNFMVINSFQASISMPFYILNLSIICTSILIFNRNICAFDFLYYLIV